MFSSCCVRLYGYLIQVLTMKFSTGTYLIVLSCGVLCFAQLDLDGAHCSDDLCSKLANGVCLNGICRCMPTFYDPGTRYCVSRIKANAKCNTTIGSPYQCQDYPNAVCENTNGNAVCTCNNMTHYNHNGACAQRISEGLECNPTISDHLQCVDQAHCDHNTSTCACSPGLFNSGGKCQPHVGIGESCNSVVTDMRQCGDNAHCEKSLCVCNADYYSSGTACFQRQPLGGACNTTIHGQCADAHAECDSANNTCECDQSHYRDEKSCQKRRAAGLPCDPQKKKQCVDGASCAKNTCDCNDGLIFREGNCEKPITGPAPTGSEPTKATTFPAPLDWEWIG